MINEPHICIIDDDEAIRESLRLLLFSSGLRVQAHESADAFLELPSVGEIECMLLDIRMPGTDGIELFRILKAKDVRYPVIFITGHGDIPLAVSAIKQGAFDFLTKPFEEGELLGKIHSAVEQYRSGKEQWKEFLELKGRAGECTPRELDVMRLLAQGLPNKGIADELGISPRTVEIHRAHVMEKMEAESLPALVRMFALLEEHEAAVE
jgi:two-component system response regulator FixJ